MRVPLVLALWLPACGGGGGDGVGEPCGPNGECPQGLVCEAATRTCQRGSTRVPDAAPGPDAFLPDAPILHTLNVVNVGQAGGAGNVTSIPAGVDCGAACAAGFLEGESVQLEARPSSGSLFRGWSGACSGPYRVCSVSMDQAVAVTASFGPIDGNLVFVSSEIYTGDLGGLGGGDANCRRLAAAAGYPGTFVALLSDASNTGLNRLGSARGFIRVDGLPIADTRPISTGG